MGNIYMVQSHQFVKIGFTGDLQRRLVTFLTYNPCEIRLLRVIPNKTIGHERWLHRHFAHLRHRHEWYNFHDEMMTIEPKMLEEFVGPLPHTETEMRMLRLYQYEWPADLKVDFDTNLGRDKIDEKQFDWVWKASNNLNNKPG